MFSYLRERVFCTLVKKSHWKPNTKNILLLTWILCLELMFLILILFITWGELRKVFFFFFNSGERIERQQVGPCRIRFKPFQGGNPYFSSCFPKANTRFGAKFRVAAHDKCIKGVEKNLHFSECAANYLFLITQRNFNYHHYERLFNLIISTSHTIASLSKKRELFHFF